MRKSINRRDVIAEAGAAAGATLVALPAVAGILPHGKNASDAKPDPFAFVDSMPTDIQCMVYMYRLRAEPVEKRRQAVAMMRADSIMQPDMVDAIEAFLMGGKTA